MSSNSLVPTASFKASNIVYSKPEVNTIPGQKLSYQRIRLNYEDDDNLSDLIIESPANLLCWGLTEQHDMVSGQLSGYQLPICLWSKNGPTEEEKNFTDMIEAICQHTKQYLESLNERKEYEKAIAKKSQEKAILAREEHEKKRQSEIDKGSIRVAEGNKKEKGFGEGAIICPICRGDGGVKECFRCDGTGWIR